MGDDLDETVERIKRREPVVLASNFDRWHRRALIALLVVDLLLTLLMLRWLNTLEDVVHHNRALYCRSLVIDGVELDPQGSCYDPSVLRYYDPETGNSR